MNEEIYICHNLGLGDHIVFNGLVRMFVGYYNKVYVLCKEKNYDQVFRMYVDDKRIVPVPQYDRKEVNRFIRENGKDKSILNLQIKRGETNFDYMIYKRCNIPIVEKWNKFYVKRNHREEEKVYNKLKMNGMDYVFVHDDPKRGYEMKPELLPDIPIVRPYDIQTDSIFDWISVIENAREVHCMDSCFLNLIDCMKLKKDGLFLHWYIRKSKKFATPTLRLDWEVL